MNIKWLNLPKKRQIEILNQASNQSRLPAVAIEKDWWVTTALKACFELEYATYLVFKGGTSLSKGWDLIERFSEDIDLAIDRSYFGFNEETITNSQIKKLRKASCKVISEIFLRDLTAKFAEWGISNKCELSAQVDENTDKDPQTIEIQYNSVLPTTENPYIKSRILIEISSRSLIEPSQKQPINDILSNKFHTLTFANQAVDILTTLPSKTFLEKIFLLHEEFAGEAKIRDRLSRHLYDLERLMDTEYGKNALENQELFDKIVAHRKVFNSLKGIDYDNHIPSKINIIPPEKVIKDWKNDYQKMTEQMFYGDFLSFDGLIERIKELQKRVNEIK